MMKKDKILINLDNIDYIEKLKELGYTNFLLSLKGYSVGYNSYTLDEIGSLKGNIYILINRLLEDTDIDSFQTLDIPSNVKGFIIEDIGLYTELKGKGYELINYQNHLNNNYETVNYFLNYYDSLVLNNDITGLEIKEILDNSNKPLIINIYGYPMIMYSRRKLLSNYSENYNIENNTSLDVYENISNHPLKFRENEYGTGVFDNHLIDYRKVLDYIDDNKVKYYIVNTLDMDIDDIITVLDGGHLDNEQEGFLNTKTVYKIGDLK